MRNFFAREISALAGKMDEVFLVYGDIGNRLFDEFKKVAPERFVNAGIAEASMISMAAGLAKSGFLPFVYTINPFIYLKALEQIKLDVCYPQLPVVMVGTGGGLAYSELGTTHHSLEDVGVLRNMPNLRIFVPADEAELTATIQSVVEHRGPTYIRIGKKETSRIHENNSIVGSVKDEFILARQSKGASVALVTFGTISSEVLEAQRLIGDRIKSDLWTVPKLHPISSNYLRKFLSRYSYVFVVEEHRGTGGLFSILAEACAETERSNTARLIAINTGDTFHTGLGEQDHARRALRIDAKSIVDRILTEV